MPVLRGRCRTGKDEGNSAAWYGSTTIGKPLHSDIGGFFFGLKIPKSKSQKANPKKQIPKNKSQEANPKKQIPKSKSQKTNSKKQIPKSKSQKTNSKKQRTELPCKIGRLKDCRIEPLKEWGFVFLQSNLIHFQPPMVLVQPGWVLSGVIVRVWNAVIA